MLPLTEGSLRLRADDEDSLISDDSFFSATEVRGEVGGHRGWGRRLGLCATLGEHGHGKVQPFPPPGAEFGSHHVLLPGDSCSGWGWGGPRSQGSQVLGVRAGSLPTGSSPR